MARIVPLYFLLSISYCVLALIPGVNARQLCNSFLFLPLLDFSYFTNPLHPYGWTLCFEVWFYLTFAVFIKLTSGRKAPIVVPIFLGIGADLIALCYDHTWYLPRFIFSPMILEFCAGCLLYQLRRRLIGKSMRLLILAIAALYAVYCTDYRYWFSLIVLQLIDC